MSTPRYKSVAFIHPDFDAATGSPGLRITPAGRLATVTDSASIRQALLLLLSTRPGERVNRPTYGCHLFRLAFAPADDTTAGLAIHYVARAVEQWERRITVISLDASRSPESPEVLEVRLKYRVRTSSMEDQIVIALPVESGGAA
jgi:phage baseplate assembly protein W